MTRGRPTVILGVGLLCFWVAAGSLGFSWIEDWSLLDGFYMAVITLSTVGYGEAHPLSDQGKVFASFLIVIGLATAVYTFTSLGQTLLEGELAQALGRRRMKSHRGKLEDHYIVCGNGRVGRTVSAYLARRHLPFCVIEIEPAAEEELREHRYRYVIGDATEDKNLILAGLPKAKAVFALLPSDADNLYLTLSAKGLNPSAVVVARASAKVVESKLERAGADHVVSPYELVGMRLLQKVLNPTLMEFMDLAIHREHLQLVMEEFRVPSDSAVAGFSIDEAKIRSRYGLIVVAFKRPDGPMLFNPDSGEKVEPGDVLVLLGPEDQVNELAHAKRA